MNFGMQHDQRGGAGVFACVVMVELKIQCTLEVRQPVSAIALQLGPCPPRDPNTVVPAQVWDVDAAEAAGGIHSLLVEIAVLDEVMAGQQRKQRVQRVREPGRIRNMIWTNAVELDVERIKSGSRIYQRGKRLDLIVWLDAGQADLAYAGCITACGFDIQRNEPETALWHARSVSESRSLRCAND